MFEIGDVVKVEYGDDYTYTKTGSIGTIIGFTSDETEDPETGDFVETEFATIKFSHVTCGETAIPMERWVWDIPIWDLVLLKTIFKVGDRIKEKRTDDTGTIITIGKDIFNANEVYYIKWDKDGSVFYLENNDIQLINKEGVTNEHSG